MAGKVAKTTKVSKTEKNEKEEKSLNIFERVNKLSESYKSIEKPEFTKTGSVVMDALLGGGVPKGSFILWSSQSGIGKSTGSLYISKGFCAQGKKVLYLDYEGGVNESQLIGIGLMPYKYDKLTNPSGNFFIFRVHTFLDAEVFLDELIGEVDLVVVDSVTAMLPSKLVEKSVEDVQPGVQARMMAGLLLKYKAKSMIKGTSWIMINQVRTHIRFVGQTTEEEAGGNALKFYADYRILMKEAFNGKLERKEMTVNGEVTVPYGSINEVWCIKSRYSRPFIPLKLGIIFGKGISNNHAYYDFLFGKGIIKKSGSWYEIELDGNKYKTQGAERVVEWIAENKDIVKNYIKNAGGYSLLVKNGEQVISGEGVEPDDSDYSTEPFVNIAEGNIEDENYRE